jgi:hypothetical protein
MGWREYGRVLASNKVAVLAEGVLVLTVALVVFVGVVSAGLATRAGKRRSNEARPFNGTSDGSGRSAESRTTRSKINAALVVGAVGFWVVLTLVPGNQVRGLTAIFAVITATALTAVFAHTSRHA